MDKIDSKKDGHSIIPPSARFIMGGIGIPYGEMLRGYVDNGIGPKRINAGYLSYDGGKIMLKYSMELIKDNLNSSILELDNIL